MRQAVAMQQQTTLWQLDGWAKSVACVLLCFVDPILRKSQSRCHSLNQGTWGGWILTLHLNYVAGYTDPLLFLFERTHNYSVDNQGLVP